MAGSLNKVMLIGNLGADPEVRTFQNGGKVCNLRLATTERWRDKSSGENKEKTEWHTVAVFSEGLVRVCEQYLRKGSKVYVEGSLRTRKWQDKEGRDRYTTEIRVGDMQMLDGKPGGGGTASMDDDDQGGYSARPAASGAPRASAPPARNNSAPSEGAFEDDDIPF